MSRELPFPQAAGDYPPSCEQEDSADSKGAAATYLHAATDPPPATDPSTAVQSKPADCTPATATMNELVDAVLNPGDSPGVGAMCTCQKCGATAQSVVQRRVGKTAWKSCVCLLCACPLLFPVSCLPLCFKSFRNVEHRCRTCNELIRNPIQLSNEAFSDPAHYRAE